MTPEKALQDLETILLSVKALDERKVKLYSTVTKIVDYLTKDGTGEHDVSDVIRELSPFVAWSLSNRDAETSIGCYRDIREAVQNSNKVATGVETDLKNYLETIGNHLLEMLNKSGSDSIKKRGVGIAYKKLKTKASAANFDGFIKWAAENDAADAIQRRINASFVTKYFDENGEYPPFLNVLKEYEVIVNKG